MASYYKSGKYGYLTINLDNDSGLRNLPIYNFSLSFSSSDLYWYDADSYGFPERTLGLPDNKFTFSAPSLDFGSDKLFDKYHDLRAYLFPYNDIYGGDGYAQHFFARITNLSGAWAWNGNSPIIYTVSLDITEFTDIQVEDTFSSEDNLCISSSCQRRVEEIRNNDILNEYYELTHLESATFNITARYARLASAFSTVTYTNIFYPLLDCTITLKFNTLLHGGTSDIIAKYPVAELNKMTLAERNKNLYSYRFYINEAEYWEFNNMLPMRVYNIVVDRVSGAIIGCTVDLSITGKGTATLGSGSGPDSDVNLIDTSIYSPGNVLVWPFAMVGL